MTLFWVMQRKAIVETTWLDAATLLVFAAEAVDEAAVALGGAFGGGRSGPGDGAEEFALFSGFAAGFLALVCFAIEGLGYGGGGSLVTQGKDFHGEVATFIFDLEGVADVDLAGGLGGLAVGEDALEVAGFGGLLAGFEEAGGPEPLVDAGAGHALIVADFGGDLNRPERADG